MRAYTLSILRQLAGGDSLINDAAIIEWANAKVNPSLSLSLYLSLDFRIHPFFFDCVHHIAAIWVFFGGGKLWKSVYVIMYLNYENWFLYFTCNGIKSLEIYTAVEIKCFWLWIFQLKEGGKKSSFTGFNDSTLSDGRTIIDLIDCIRRGMINYDLVKDGASEEVSLSDQSSAH